MSNLECKHRLYKKVGLIGKAFSHEVRLELIELLSQCPQTVEKLSEMLDEDYKSISAHLRVLYRAGLVTCTRNGRFQRYGLASPKVAALAVMIRAPRIATKGRTGFSTALPRNSISLFIR